MTIIPTGGRCKQSKSSCALAETSTLVCLWLARVRRAPAMLLVCLSFLLPVEEREETPLDAGRKQKGNLHLKYDYLVIFEHFREGLSTQGNR